ncbi:HNH endonuclease [Qipengyuania sp. NPDC077563]|uniref:HNH endonuclease n=1 Tax=Qipengyuania sp. NPDC077563 TaxID=3364497 RepID=UPI00384F49A6
MIETEILTEKQRPLSAKVEVGDSRVVLHSRSGSAGNNERNPEYRKALELILSRLHEEGAYPKIYLDSGPVQDRPLNERLLLDTSEVTASVEDQFDEIVRRSNAGSRSRGAYRRLLIITPRQPAYSIIPIIQGTILQGGKSGLPAAVLRQVRKEHIETAIDELAGNDPRWHSFADPREYWLIADNGDALPAKAVFGVALSEALRTYTHSYLFSSGPGNTAFRIMNDLGYSIEKRGIAGTERFPATRKRTPRAELEKALADVPPTDDERTWTEGNPRIAKHLRKERAAGLARLKKKQFIAENGRLWCERCKNDWVDLFGAALAEGCMEVHHSIPISEMKPGHETTLDQLQVLCANCHRIVHRELASG